MNNTKDIQKIEKLLSLFNDNSITEEEKRTIAVKIVEIGKDKFRNQSNTKDNSEYKFNGETISVEDVIDKYNILHREYDRMFKNENKQLIKISLLEEETIQLASKIIIYKGIIALLGFVIGCIVMKYKLNILEIW